LKFQCLFLYVLLPTNEGYKGEGIMGVVIVVQCFEALPLADRSTMPMALHEGKVAEHSGRITK
jgi:hypothetical protein